MRKFDPEFFRVKAAIADLIERCGGQKRAGEIVGVSQQQMSRIAHREDGAMLTLAGKLALERDCGEPLVTSVEVELLGYRLERAGAAPAGTDGCPLSAHAAVLREVADLCRAFAEAVADGQYSRTDSVTVDRQLSELVREIERFRRVNAAAMAGGAA